MHSVKIMIFLAAWKRYKITEICFKGIKRLMSYDKKRFDISALCVGSEPQVQKLCKKHGIKYTYFPNSPLGAKKNHGIREALKQKWDYMLEIGSDDLLRNEILDIYYGMFISQEPYFGINNVCYINSSSLQVKGYKSKTVFGAGRVIRRDLIENCTVIDVRARDTFISNGSSMNRGQTAELESYRYHDYGSLVEALGKPRVALWNNDINRALDGHSDMRLAKYGWKHKMLNVDEPLICDIKSEVNIGPWSDKIGNYNIEFDWITENFPECLALAKEIN